MRETPGEANAKASLMMEHAESREADMDAQLVESLDRAAVSRAESAQLTGEAAASLIDDAERAHAEAALESAMALDLETGVDEHRIASEVLRAEAEVSRVELEQLRAETEQLRTQPTDPQAAATRPTPHDRPPPINNLS